MKGKGMEKKILNWTNTYNENWINIRCYQAVEAIHTLSINCGLSVGLTLTNSPMCARTTPYMNRNLIALIGLRSLATSSFESPIRRYQFLDNEKLTNIVVPETTNVIEHVINDMVSQILCGKFTTPWHKLNRKVYNNVIWINESKWMSTLVSLQRCVTAQRKRSSLFRIVEIYSLTLWNFQ